MELKEMIEQAAHKVGGQKQLAHLIGESEQNLSGAKKGRRGLTLEACGKLGEILEIDRWTVAAASKLVTEKDPERRAYLTPFVSGLAKAASFAALAIVTTFATTKTESLADTGVQASNVRGIYIMRN